MRRASKKTPAASASKTAARATKFNPRNVQSMWVKYADGEPVMDMEGISRLGEDIGLDPSKDVAILVLCWKLGAKTAGQISKDEFESGMERLEADSIATLTRLVPALDPGFMDPTKFRDFYRFAFQYSREGTTRTLEKELVAVLLPMVMANRSPHTADFVQFLEQSEMATRITFDQWSSFLEFSNSVRADLSGYDEDGAWPILLDEFVEWVRAKRLAEMGVPPAPR